jgi:Tol biopolymer transport system component
MSQFSRAPASSPLFVAALVALLAGPLAAAALAQEPIVRANLTWQGLESQTSGAGASRLGAISDDGRWVVFASSAYDLVPNDNNGWVDVFVRDLVAGTTTRLSVAPGGVEADFHSGTFSPVISGNGRFVAFGSSASNLVANDLNGSSDIFVLDRDPGDDGTFDEEPIVLERVSVSSNGSEANGACEQPSISADGNKVAFRSWATNLIAVDLNGAYDVFVHTRSSGTTIRASRNNSDIGGDGDSVDPQICANGSAVVFRSLATNFGSAGVPMWQMWVRDLVANKLELASSDANGARLSDPSETGAISGDGRYVVFISSAKGLAPEENPGGTTPDVFVKDRVTGAVDCMSTGPDGLAGHSSDHSVISVDGGSVSFSSRYGSFVAGDTNNENDIFVRDVATKAIRCASIDRSGAPAASGTGSNYDSALSADGRFALFSSDGTDYVSDDTNIYADLFVHDLANPGFQATWSNYGAGWPGTFGVPSFTLDVDPEFGATVTATASNSVAFWTAGFLAIGFAEAVIPTNRGGTLLVEFISLTPVAVPPGGYSFCEDIPYDPALCGVELDLQMIEFDPGASDDLSFSQGLKVVIGR